MAPAIHDESDWSDSDEEDARSDVETNVLLGIPDGEIKSQEEINDAAVSRIGGRPVRYPVPYFLSCICIYVFRHNYCLALSIANLLLINHLILLPVSCTGILIEN